MVASPVGLGPFAPSPLAGGKTVMEKTIVVGIPGDTINPAG